jgi:hypothetical protein
MCRLFYMIGTSLVACRAPVWFGRKIGLVTVRIFNVFDGFALLRYLQVVLLLVTGVAFTWSYLASVMRMSSEGPGRDTHRPRRAGETTFGGDIVPRAATGWGGCGAARRMQGGLFLKIVALIGSGAKAVKYFSFGPEYLFP